MFHLHLWFYIRSNAEFKSVSMDIVRTISDSSILRNTLRKTRCTVTLYNDTVATMLARWDEPEIVGILEMNSDLSKIADMHMNQLLSHSFCRYTKGVVGNFFSKVVTTIQKHLEVNTHHRSFLNGPVLLDLKTWPEKCMKKRGLKSIELVKLQATVI